VYSAPRGRFSAFQTYRRVRRNARDFETTVFYDDNYFVGADTYERLVRNISTNRFFFVQLLNYRVCNGGIPRDTRSYDVLRFVLSKSRTLLSVRSDALDHILPFEFGDNRFINNL